MLKDKNNLWIPELDEIIAYYKEKGLLAHEETIRLMSEKLRDIPVGISLEEIVHNVSLLKIWPLIEKYKILKHSVTADLTREETDKLGQLDVKYAKLKSSGDMDKISERMSRNPDICFINPFILPKEALLNYVLSASIMCEPLDEHIRKTNLSKTKLFHDTQMGGSIYIMGKPSDEKQYLNRLYSFLQRAFICMNHKSEPVMFMDSIEGGYPYFRKLDHWRGISEADELIVNTFNRVHEVYFALAGTMYVAENLGIKKIIPRDYELTELGRMLGIGEKTSFSKEQDYWKIGLHSQKRRSGVYTHSLYRGRIKNIEGHQLRHLVLEAFPLKHPTDMADELRGQSDYIIQSNSGRKKHVAKTNERINALKALNHIIQEHPLTPPDIKANSNQITQAISYY